jgi:2-polyprenyl-3-methyl-5-hydroxy-6-metoxy-1,4-benzoquinol methylase
VINDRIDKCISCNSSNFNYYDEHLTLKLPIYICKNCQLNVLGTSQKELDEKIEHFYDEEFWKNQHDEQLKSNFKDKYSIGRIRLWRSQIKYCKEILNTNKTILEIGSGHGEAIYNFDKIGYTVTGIEPDKTNVSFINKKLTNSICMVGKAETISFDKKFDIIWLNHVFEHLSKPIEFLNKIESVLDQHGFIFIEVPSVEKTNDWRKFNSAPHAYNYSKQSLINISKKSNYTIIKCDYFRPPTIIEGVINKIFTKFLKKDYFKYYPKILCNKGNGENLRIILTKNSN